MLNSQRGRHRIFQRPLTKHWLWGLARASTVSPPSDRSGNSHETGMQSSPSAHSSANFQLVPKGKLGPKNLSPHPVFTHVSTLPSFREQNFSINLSEEHLRPKRWHLCAWEKEKKTQSGQQSEETCVWRLAKDSWVSRRKPKFGKSPDLEAPEPRTVVIWMGLKSESVWGKALRLTQPEDCPSLPRQRTASEFTLWRGWTQVPLTSEMSGLAQWGDSHTEKKEIKWKSTCPLPQSCFPRHGVPDLYPYPGRILKIPHRRNCTASLSFYFFNFCCGEIHII